MLLKSINNHRRPHTADHYKSRHYACKTIPAALQITIAHKCMCVSCSTVYWRRVFNNTKQTLNFHRLQTLSSLQHVGGRNHTRDWLHSPQTEHKWLRCHDERDSTRRRWCKDNLQPNTWEEVLPVEMSQLLTQNKTNTEIPRKLNRAEHGITPTYLLLLSNIQESRTRNLWCTK